MAKFYKLRPATRIEGIVPPALDASYVKNKEHLFSRNILKLVLLNLGGFDFFIFFGCRQRLVY